MSTPVGEQVRKRRAVKAALERHKVVFCSARYREGMPASIRVLVDGDYYDILEDEFRSLKQGVPPARLGLTPAGEYGDDPS